MLSRTTLTIINFSRTINPQKRALSAFIIHTKLNKRILHRSLFTSHNITSDGILQPSYNKNTIPLNFSLKATITSNNHEIFEDPKWDPKLPPHPTVEYKPDELTNMNLDLHYETKSIHDKIAWYLVRSLRVLSDIFFKDRYLNRAVVLETVAAVPGMVAGMLRHLQSLRKMERSYGWITTLLTEAENERMHLLTWMSMVKPTAIERFLVISTQAVYFVAFSCLYIFSPKIAHRFTGYLEEEAIKSYTTLLKHIDEGKIKNVPAPEIAIKYWNLSETATLRDVVLVVRADEAGHRDVNHLFSNRLQAGHKY